MRVGIGSWTYGWSIGVPGYPQPQTPLTPVSLVAMAKNLGAGVVQFADNLPVSLDQVATLCTCGIEVEIGTRGTETSQLIEQLDVARGAGAKLLRTIIDTDLDTATGSMREALPSFERAGVSIAIENYERHTTADLAAFVSRFDSPNLGICLDTVNSMGALEPPEKVVENLSPYVLSLHVKDFEIERVRSKMGFQIIGRPVGCGRLNVPWILEQLANRGRSPNMIVELWTPWTGALEPTMTLEQDWARRSVAYLKAFEQG